MGTVTALPVRIVSTVHIAILAGAPAAFVLHHQLRTLRDR